MDRKLQVLKDWISVTNSKPNPSRFFFFKIKKTNLIVFAAWTAALVPRLGVVAAVVLGLVVDATEALFEIVHTQAFVLLDDFLPVLNVGHPVIKIGVWWEFELMILRKSENINLKTKTLKPKHTPPKKETSRSPCSCSPGRRRGRRRTRRWWFGSAWWRCFVFTFLVYWWVCELCVVMWKHLIIIYRLGLGVDVVMI